MFVCWLFSSIFTLLYQNTVKKEFFFHFKKGGAELGKTPTNRAKQFWMVLGTNEFGLIVPGSI